MIAEDRLAAIEAFATLSADELRRLAALTVEERYETGANLVREGDFATDLYVIEAGTAAVIRQGQAVGSVGSGDIVGEIGVVGKEQRTASIVATAPLLVLKISHWEVKHLSAETRAKLAALADERRRRDEFSA